MNLDSPCLKHPGKLECYHVFKHSTQVTGIAAALALDMCPKEAEMALSCGHSIWSPCWKETKMISGDLLWPSCSKASPIPYTFPSCGHTRPVTCSKLMDFNENPGTVKCEQEVDSILSCGHNIRLPCWKESRMMSGDLHWPSGPQPSLTQYTFPLCGHTRPATCSELANFTEIPGTVKCEQDDDFHPSCGHLKRTKCWQKEEFQKWIVKFFV